MRFALILALLFVALFAVDASADGRQGFRGSSRGRQSFNGRRDNFRRGSNNNRNNNLELALLRLQLQQNRHGLSLREQLLLQDLRNQQFRSRGTTLQFRF